jgi:Amt family ammonium transporter
MLVVLPTIVLAQSSFHTKTLSGHPQSIDIVWVLLASFLIFFMQAGFSMIEVGFTRAKNAGNVVMKNLSDFTVGSVTFFMIGYGLMFGASRFGLFGTTDFFLNRVGVGEDINNWKFANLIFQVVFAATAATIVSGAMAERTRFIGYLAYSLIVSALIYPIVGHWVWGGGWLSRLGMIDFAGSTVVHSVGGWVSLAGVLVLGPRIGRFNRDGSSNPIAGHNMPLVALGVFIMWLGWYGFNTGSALSGANPSIALIAVNTTLSGVCGSISSMVITWFLRRRPDVGISLNGALAGLVASTATSALVSPYSAMIIGVVAGIILVYSLRVFERLKIDDAVGAISVHGACGVWGTVAVGLFAEAPFARNSLGLNINGLFFAGGTRLLGAQIIGILAVFLWAWGIAFLFFKLIDKTIGLRVSPQEEIKGLDYSEHFMSSYPLFDDFRKRQEKIQEELKRIRELSVLHEISKSMQTLNLDEILHLILDGVTKAIGFDRTRLYLINEKKTRLECKMAVGIEKEKIKGIALPLGKENSMLARSVIEKKPFIVEDALNDPRVNKDLKELFGLKSFAVVPLIGRDKVLGAITADNLFSDRIITPEKFESLVTFANQAGLALENAKMYGELKLFSHQLEERVKIATGDLKRTQDKLIQSEKLAALGKLSAGIAHEIRNPLTSIKVLIHSLAEKIKDTETKEKDIKVLEDEIERVNQIIKRFLDFVRPKEPEFSLVDINQILEGTINLVSGKVKEQNAVLNKELSSLPHIQADQEQMRQVFLNLFLNAVQAMPEGGKLRIKTRLRGQCIQIEIQDEGTGIPDQIKDKLFEPFFTMKEEGIGLGLSIVKRIIDDHKGSIEVRNNYPKGTVFTINLPINTE